MSNLDGGWEAFLERTRKGRRHSRHENFRHGDRVGAGTGCGLPDWEVRGVSNYSVLTQYSRSEERRDLTNHILSKRKTRSRVVKASQNQGQGWKPIL